MEILWVPLKILAAVRLSAAQRAASAAGGINRTLLQKKHHLVLSETEGE